MLNLVPCVENSVDSVFWKDDDLGASLASGSCLLAVDSRVSPHDAQRFLSAWYGAVV